MGLPSKRRTKTSKKERASHFALKKQQFNKCIKCGKPVLAHRACPKCGTYRGLTAINIKTKTKTLRQRDKLRKAETKEKSQK